MRTRRLLSATLTTMSLLHCGGATTQQQASADTTPPVVAQRERAREGYEGSSGGIVIEGQLGFLSEAQLRGTLQPALTRLQECYTRRLDEHPYLAGALSFKIRIGADGAVRWTIPTSTTLGDRTAERCMLDVLAGLTFPRPRGGETETTYPIELAGGEDVREAVRWEPARIQRVVDRRRAALTACGAGPFDLTLYAAPGGRVATAGISVPTSEQNTAAECILREAATWQLPDPGGYAAKTTVRVP